VQSLTEAQRREVQSATTEPPRFVDPDTRIEYVILPVDTYERIKPLLTDESPSEADESGVNQPDEIVRIEGLWDDVKNQGSILSGQHVRLTFVGNPEQSVNGRSSEQGKRPPNMGMLHVLQKLEEIRKDMNPKIDKKNYLREAREGAIYGFGD